MYCLLNDRILPECDARVPALDRGFLYADGLFETLRAYGSRPFLLAEHWARMVASAAFLGLPVPSADPAGWIERVLQANALSDASVRITLTRGPLPAGPRPAGAGEPTFLVQARTLRPHLQRLSAEGLEARRLPWPLRARGLPLQGHKTLAYLPSVLALGAVPEGVEPLLETTEGHVSEGATTNVFWARGGRLCTPHPDCGCLPGITRRLVLSLTARLGIPAEEGLYPAAALAEADEAFVTNAVVEVTPLVRLDGAAVGNGSPGLLTRRLQQAYRDEVCRHTAGAPSPARPPDGGGSPS